MKRIKVVTSWVIDGQNNIYYHIYLDRIKTTSKVYRLSPLHLYYCKLNPLLCISRSTYIYATTIPVKSQTPTTTTYKRHKYQHQINISISSYEQLNFFVFPAPSINSQLFLSFPSFSSPLNSQFFTSFLIFFLIPFNQGPKKRKERKTRKPENQKTRKPEK